MKGFMKEIKRHIEDLVIQSLNHFPVVFIADPRQSRLTEFKMLFRVNMG